MTGFLPSPYFPIGKYGAIAELFPAARPGGKACGQSMFRLPWRYMLGNDTPEIADILGNVENVGGGEMLPLDTELLEAGFTPVAVTIEHDGLAVALGGTATVKVKQCKIW